MDIGGVNKFKPIVALKEKANIDQTRHSNADKDADGKQNRQERPHVEQLSKEQEEKALEKLNAQASFVQSGLKAELIREEGKHPHILVKKPTGDIVRRLPYQQVIAIFMSEDSEDGSGLLLNSKA